MKKTLAVIAVLLLSLCLLWGCNGNTATTPTTEALANENASLYYNLDKGATLTADAGGAYTLRFVCAGQQVALKVTDQTLLDSLLLLDFMGLELEGDTITGIVHMHHMPYQRLAWDFYVQSIGGKNVKLNSSSALIGSEVLVTLPEDIVAYDYSPLSSNFGSATELQKGDRATVIADHNGTVKYVYITDRSTALSAEKRFCEHCQAEVSWYEWLSSTDMPISGGHYMLMNDVNMVDTAKLGAVELCLDLNGKTATQTSFGTRMYTVADGGTLSIIDSAGGGTMIPASTENSGSYAKWGMIINTEAEGCTVNLYSGTLDASNCTAQYGCAVNQTEGTFNMYGGTILGGIAYGTGSSAIRAGGNVNMYGGKIVGGKLIDIGYQSENPVGGAVIRVAGTLTIYDGIIEGGESWTYGGNIYLSTSGRLIMSGGTITGGKASAAAGVYVSPLSYVRLSGDAKITGNENDNLFLTGSSKLYIGEGGLGENAQIGITMMESGDFVFGVPADVDVAKHFVSDDTSKKVVSTGNGNWGVK